MGFIFSKILFIKNFCYEKKEYFVPIFGNECCGKSTIINKLRQEKGEFIIPHIGIKMEVTYKKLRIEELLPFSIKPIVLWKYYLTIIDGLILVVDSSNKESIEETADIFWKYFAESVRNINILIVANKQDLKEALSVDEISSILKLENLNENKWKIVPNSFNNLDELYKGLDWIDNLLKIDSKNFLNHTNNDSQIKFRKLFNSIP